MMSIMSECEINRQSFDSPDLSFFGLENPQEEGTRAFVAAGQPPPGDDFKKGRVLGIDLEDRVSEDVGRDPFGSLRSPVKPGGARVSESHEVAVASWTRGFQLGDMVWGKVKSHPWWPGQIFNEAFATPSVCRMKREGHLLVAFFGDSSYGWFDPDELIPFDPHFPEKSRQTSSRNFVKAVEEAVDEVSRRGALAVTCRCRNPDNYRPTAVPGCVSVDVVGYEPRGIYSSRQIEKARDNFVPSEVISFVHQLAVRPQRIETSKSVDWFRGVAVLLAYRRAVFEEFDETYAEAFGAQPDRPTINDSGMPDQQDKFAPRAAPLSGPLVIAEALGEKRSSTKAAARAAAKIPSLPSTSSKKNKFVLKRRDETPATIPPLPDLRSATQLHGDRYSDLAPGRKPQASVVIPSASPTSGDISSAYALQQRATAGKPTGDLKAGRLHDDSSKQEVVAGPINKTAARRSGSLLELPTGHPPAGGPRSVWEDFDDWMMKPQTPPHVDAHEPVGRPEITEPTGHSIDAVDTWVDSKQTAETNPSADLDSARYKLDMPSLPRDRSAESRAMEPTPGKAREAAISPLDGVVKKEKVRKRPVDGSIDVKKERNNKKKKLKRDAAADEAGSTVSPPPKLVSDSLELELPHLVADLSALALNPFHGIDRDAPDIVRHVFLRFRSTVYQKSLPPAGDADMAEVPAAKPSAGRSPLEPGALTEIAPAKGVKEQVEPASSSKPFKPVSRPDDPTKTGRKRVPSDRQEEMSAKRLKKLSQLKALAKDKKAGIRQKDPEGQLRDQKDASVKTSSAVAAAAAAPPVKKQEPRPAPGIPAPTSLVLNFPPRTTLPSIPTLKVRFGRFGQLDLSGTRVSWKTHSCKVLFRYKSDAQAAYNHAQNNDLFGQAKVSYFLRELESPVPEPPSSPDKRRAESHLDGVAQFRPGNGSGVSASQSRPLSYQQQQRQSSVQLKSILKKPGDEAGGGVRESPRVKFMLGGDDGRGEPPLPVVVASNGNGGSGADGASSSLRSLESISKNPRSVNFLPPPPPPPHPRPSLPQPPHVFDNHWLPPPPPPHSHPPPSPAHIADASGGRGVLAFIEAQPGHRPHDNEAEQREGSRVDISSQLLGLLVRCSDIVALVKASLGYVPYHPL